MSYKSSGLPLLLKSKPFEPKAQEMMIDIIKKYLNHRPPFFSILRPQEAYLFYHFQKYLESRLLDYGHGDGFFAQVISGWLKTKIELGVDIEQSRINEAAQYQSCSRLESYDGKKINSSDNYFASIISNCVFEHLPDLEQSLRELHRVLKPGGYVLTSVMTDRWEDFLFGAELLKLSKMILGIKLREKYLSFWKRRQEHFNLLSSKSWRKKFDQAGFEVVHEVGYLSKRASKLLELSHFLSVSTLFSYRLFGKWVLLKNWFYLLGSKEKGLHQIYLNEVAKSLFIDTHQSAALFYVLRKQ